MQIRRCAFGRHAHYRAVRVRHRLTLPIAALTALLFTGTASAFEGRISATLTRGTETNELLYTVGPERIRIELTATDWPHCQNLVDRNSGAITLLFPHNRSFVHLKLAAENPTGTPSGFPQPPGGLPPGVGPQPPVPPAGLPPGIGPANLPGRPAMPKPPSMPALPAGLPPGVGPQAQPPATPGAPVMPNLPAAGAVPSMPAMPMMPMPMEKMELKATGEKTKLLGFACEKFEIKQRGETMEIWATDQLFPYRPYVRTQPSRFGPPTIEEQWPGLLTSRKLFPLRAILHYDNGTERFHFEVKFITPEKIVDREGNLFQPPSGYMEIAPLPF